MTAAVEALWKRLESEPADGTAKAALVDALLEAGDPDTAATVKWLLERRLWPKFEQWQAGYRQSKWRPAGAAWCYHYGQLPKNRQKPLLNYLPDPLYRMTAAESASLPEAVAALTGTFRRLWELIPQRLQ